MLKKFVPFSSVWKAGCPAASGLPSTPLPRGRLHRSEAGVTLMEMLVASVVMLFVMAGLATILVSTTRIQAYQNELAEAQQNMRIILTMTGDRIARAGTGLMPRTLAFQTTEELWINNHYVKTAAEAAEPTGLTQQNILFGVYYQRDMPGETAGAGAPILQPLTQTQYESNFGWRKASGTAADVNVKAPAAFLDADKNSATQPGLSILLYNVDLGNYIVVNEPTAKAKLEKLYTKALHFTRLDDVSENIDEADASSKSISRITVLHAPTAGTHPDGWIAGNGTAGGDTPILAYVGIAHAVFAYKQEILPNGMPDGKFYMAEFMPSTNSNVADVQGQFDLYAENVYDLEVVGVFRDPASGLPIRAQIFPTLATFSTSITPSSGTALQDHYVNRVNLRETEITVTVRTGEPVPAGKMKGLYVPAPEMGYVYRVVRGSTRSHMQAYYMGFSAAAGATGG